MRYLPLLCLVAAPLEAGPVDEPAARGAAERAAAQAAWTAEELYDARRYESAVTAYGEAVRALTAAFGEAHTRTLIAMNNMAAALLQIGRGGEAETALRDALARRERAGLGEDENLAVTWTNLGEALLLNGRTTASVAVHERALALKQNLHPAQHPEIAMSLTNLAEALRQAGELTRARALFEQAARAWAVPARGQAGAASMPLMPGFARAKNSLGLILDAEGLGRHAESAFIEALEASARTYGARHEFTATIQFNLAGHYAQSGEWKSAEEHCSHALNVYEVLPAFNDSRLAQALNLHASILDHIGGRKAEAKAQRRRAGEILSFR